MDAVAHRDNSTKNEHRSRRSISPNSYTSKNSQQSTRQSQGTRSNRYLAHRFLCTLLDYGHRVDAVGVVPRICKHTASLWNCSRSRSKPYHGRWAPIYLHSFPLVHRLAPQETNSGETMALPRRTWTPSCPRCLRP